MEEEPRLYDLIFAIVRQVPRGRVATYGQVARIAGRCSAQMVGFALASLASCSERQNFEEVPWQRIINAKGKISPHGFGMGGFIQRQLLEEEGVAFDSEGVIDLERFGWNGVLTTPVRDRRNLI
ncbi:MAG: MGMT family protein [Anaerolineaceae bacterium]|jgi:methylated-DNA-protein-cysteine methyltransferase-like protein